MIEANGYVIKDGCVFLPGTADDLVKDKGERGFRGGRCHRCEPYAFMYLGQFEMIVGKA